ncbi:MAG: hypothetical protein ACPG4T_24885, partial [Nannocystaceae bacterium]
MLKLLIQVVTVFMVTGCLLPDDVVFSKGSGIGTGNEAGSATTTNTSGNEAGSATTTNTGGSEAGSATNTSEVVSATDQMSQTGETSEPPPICGPDPCTCETGECFRECLNPNNSLCQFECLPQTTCVALCDGGNCIDNCQANSDCTLDCAQPVCITI